MKAIICDCCGETVPEDSIYFRHVYSTARVGHDGVCSHEYHDICSLCHSKILDYILNDIEFDKSIVEHNEKPPEVENGETELS